MSKVALIRLIGDTSGTLPGFGSEKTPNTSVKPSEVRWNDMNTEEPDDALCRQHFCDRSEIIAKSSGVVTKERWAWADWIADQSVEAEAVFAFAPHHDLFLTQHNEIVQALVQQKTQYRDFFQRHDRKTGHLKSFIIRTENWFTGIGLIIWQCQALLINLGQEKRVSLTEVKAYFDRIAKRTRTVSILPSRQLNAEFRDQILEENLFSRLTGSLSKSAWVSFVLGVQQSQRSEKESLNALLNTYLSELIKIIENRQLAFSRIVISCNSQQLAVLKTQAAFLEFDRMQSAFGFKWIHHTPPISAQILTGKDAIHISYAIK